MPGDVDVDDRLRQLAVTSLDQRASEIDVDVAWAEQSHQPPTRYRTSWGRRRGLVASAAALIIIGGAVALASIAGRDGPATPIDEIEVTVPSVGSATVPSIDSSLPAVASSTVPSTTASVLPIEAELILGPSSLPKPDVYPLPRDLGPDDFADGAVRAQDAQVAPSNPSRVSALVGRPDGAGFRDVVRLSMSWQSSTPGDPIDFGDPAGSIDAGGRSYQARAEPGAVPGTDAVTVVLDAEWNLTATGRDLATFLADADVDELFRAQEILDGVGSFTIGADSLPDGYELIREPEISVRPGSLIAQSWLRSSEGSVTVATVDLLHDLATNDPIEPIVVDGFEGWLTDGAAVLGLSPTTYAMVSPVESADDVADVLAGFDFVDEATWRSTLQLDDPGFDSTGARPLTLDRGSEAGIVRDSLVFDGDEFVGVVTDVADGSSAGVRTSDPRFSVPVDIAAIPDAACWLRGHNDHTGLHCSDPATLERAGGGDISVQVGGTPVTIATAGRVLTIEDSTHRLVQWLTTPSERAVGELLTIWPPPR